MRSLLFLLVFVVSPAFGASDFYEAFDFTKCRRWAIDNEPHGIDLSLESKEYISALELANRQPKSLNEERLITVYSAGTRDKSKKYIEKFGACYGSTSIQVTCLPNQDFPLAGATYKKIRSKGQLVALACVSGCRGVPAFIYDMGYEPMDGERNIEHETAGKKFGKLCGGAQ
jgi:hypothetical protein